MITYDPTEAPSGQQEPVTHVPGDLVRVRHDDGRVDLVQIVSAWTAYASGLEMLTVRHRPFGLRSFMVRADQVLAGDTADVRHDATECDLDCVEHAAERRAARFADGWGE